MSMKKFILMMCLLPLLMGQIQSPDDEMFLSIIGNGPGNPTPPSTSVNYMPYPSAYNGANWTFETGVHSPGSDVPGPATEYARYVLHSGTADPNDTAYSDQFEYTGPSIVCASMYTKWAFSGNSGTCTLRFANFTDLASMNVTYTWVGTVATFGGFSGDAADGAGIEAIGDNWYRVYVYGDTEGEWLGDTVNMAFQPYGASATADHGIIADGHMLNEGTSPSSYVDP